MIPESVKYIIGKLKSCGYEAYIVGGAVRDYYLKRSINDWDITTDALPDQIESLFDQTYAVGKAFGTIVVVINDTSYEITTFRVDSLITNGRKPESVSYTTNLLEDLKRRDFTMNAMVMDDSMEFVDPFGGRRDLDTRIIRTVGIANDRFNEDYLRVFRYIRFNTQLNFIPNTLIDETIRNLPINASISFERIQNEFNKILLSDKPSIGIRHLQSVNLLKYILPGIELTFNFLQHCPYHDKDVFEHSLCVLDNTPKDLAVRIAALLHDIGKPNTFELVDGIGHFYGHDKASVDIAITILKRLKYPNKLIDEVVILIQNHMRLLDSSNIKSLNKFIRKIGSDNIEKWILLRKADIMGSITQETLNSVDVLYEKLLSIINETPPITVNDLAVTGYDLMALGYHGKEIGIIKNHLLEIVDGNSDLNTKDVLIPFAKSFIQK